MPAPDPTPPPTRNWGCFSIIGAIVVGIFVLGLIGNLVKPASDSTNAATNAQSASSPGPSSSQSAAPSAGEPAPGNQAQPNWSYSEDKDAMRGTVTKYAQVQSDNELDFGFPYGTSRGTLMLRRRPSDGLNVMLLIHGQFICNNFQGDTVSVKFDDRPIERFPCAEPSDGSSGAIFIEGATRFVKKLRGASKVIIEAQFFQSGNQQLTFSVGGLNW